MTMNCPSCGSEYRPGHSECADCKVPLVEPLAGSMPRTRRRWPRFPTIPKLPDNRPFLVKVIPYLAFFLGGGAVLAMLIRLLDVGTFFSTGKAISGKEFLFQVALPLSALTLVYFTIAFAFWRETVWSRHFLMACLTLVILGQGWLGVVWTSRFELGLFTLDAGVPASLLLLVFAGWYLYVKANVRAYFQGLKIADHPAV